MRLVIFGSTGGTGQHLLRQALEDGHEVVAVARRPEAITQESPRLQVVRADALDLATLPDTLRGAEAVLSVLGVGQDFRTTTVISRGTANLVAAMTDAGVRRLLCVTSAGGLYDPREPFLFRVFGRALLKNIFADQARAEAVVQASALDYTLVRPSRLTNGKRTDVYRLARETYVPGGTSVSRADLAAFLLSEARACAYLRCAVAIGY